MLYRPYQTKWTIDFWFIIYFFHLFLISVDSKAEWKKSTKMCQLTQYMLNFPKLITDGETQIKIIFDPSKHPQLSLFRKVPSNFEFKIEFDLDSAVPRKVIKSIRKCDTRIAETFYGP